MEKQNNTTEKATKNATNVGAVKAETLVKPVSKGAKKAILITIFSLLGAGIIAGAVIFLLIFLTTNVSPKYRSNGEPDYLSKMEIEDIYTENVDDFKGYFVKSVGYVQDVINAENTHAAIISLNTDNAFSDQSIALISDDELDIVAFDYVLFEGYITGKVEDANDYSRAYGGLTKLSKTSLEKSSYKDAVVPTIKTIEPPVAKNHAGLMVKVDKVEIAEKQTRVYYTVSNKTGDRVYLWGSTSKIRSNGKIVENIEDYNLLKTEDELAGNLKDGEKVSGVVIYDAIDENKDFTIEFKASSVNYKTAIDKFELLVENK